MLHTFFYNNSDNFKDINKNTQFSRNIIGTIEVHNNYKDIMKWQIFK